MKVKFFVGLTFKQKHYLTQKVQGFRARYDESFNKNKYPHISLFAPFMVDIKDMEVLQFDLEEEIETFFYGHKQDYQVEILGLDTYKHKKKHLLFLNPSFSNDLQFMIERLSDISHGFVSEKANTSRVEKNYLTMGRFIDSFSLLQGVNDLRNEFEFPLNLQVESISLFMKYPQGWLEKTKLISFENSQIKLEEALQYSL
jgi:hypothetical protein